VGGARPQIKCGDVSRETLATLVGRKSESWHAPRAQVANTKIIKTAKSTKRYSAREAPLVSFACFVFLVSKKPRLRRAPGK
jgi:hypothetical protein